MTTLDQKARASRLLALHAGPNILVLPNAWDAVSARVLEEVGFAAIGTTSSGVAAALGYPDGQRMPREVMLEGVERIIRAVQCPVSVDIEAGYGRSIEDILKTVRRLIELGAAGINIEDSAHEGKQALVDPPYQVELLGALRWEANCLDTPLVINARVDAFLLADGDHAGAFDGAVARAAAYCQAGADCVFPITLSDAGLIERFTQAMGKPVNILAGPNTPSIPELAGLGARRVSFGSNLLRAALGRLRLLAQELHSQGSFTNMAPMLSGADLHRLTDPR